MCQSNVQEACILLEETGPIQERTCWNHLEDLVYIGGVLVTCRHHKGLLRNFVINFSPLIKHVLYRARLCVSLITMHEYDSLPDDFATQSF